MNIKKLTLKTQKNIRVAWESYFGRDSRSNVMIPHVNLILQNRPGVAGLLGLVLFFSAFFLVSCSGKSSKEEALLKLKQEARAKEISKKADQFWARGKEVDALELYKQLALEYPETNAKEIAEKKMGKEGISIGAGLTSWTTKRMFKLENTIIAYRGKKGSYPIGHQVKHPKDAWGNSVYVKYFHKKGYDFIVYSNGPDGKKGTNDDLLLVHGKEADIVKDKLSNTMSLNEFGNMSTKYKSKDSNAGGQETEMSLEELKNFSGSGEMEMSLEELKNLSGGQ